MDVDIFKVFIAFVPILFLSWCFGCKARGILAHQPGIETVLPALEGEILMTGLPGKSLQLFWGGDFFLFVLFSVGPSVAL